MMEPLATTVDSTLLVIISATIVVLGVTDDHVRDEVIALLVGSN